MSCNESDSDDLSFSLRHLTAAVGANKRLLATCVKVGGAWYASIHVSP